MSSRLGLWVISLLFGGRTVQTQFPLCFSHCRWLTLVKVATKISGNSEKSYGVSTEEYLHFSLEDSYCKLLNLFILSSYLFLQHFCCLQLNSLFSYRALRNGRFVFVLIGDKKLMLCCKDRGNTNIKKSLTTLGQYSTSALSFLLGDRNDSSILVQSSLFTKNTSTMLIPLAPWKPIQITFLVINSKKLSGFFPGSH